MLERDAVVWVVPMRVEFALRMRQTSAQRYKIPMAGPVFKLARARRLSVTESLERPASANQQDANLKPHASARGYA